MSSDGQRKLSTVSVVEDMVRSRSGSLMSQEGSMSSTDMDQQLVAMEKETHNLKQMLKQQKAVNAALQQAYDESRKDVFLLKEKLEKAKSAQKMKAALTGKPPTSGKGLQNGGMVNGVNGHSGPASPAINGVKGQTGPSSPTTLRRKATPSPSPSQDSQRPASATVDAEIAKALKSFFKDVKGVQQELHHIKEQNDKVATEDSNVVKSVAVNQQDKLRQVDNQLNACVRELKSNVAAAIRKMKNQTNGH